MRAASAMCCASALLDGQARPRCTTSFDRSPPCLTAFAENKIAHISLPILFNPNMNGLEDARELPLPIGATLVDRYRIVAAIGKGSFSRVFQCFDLRHKVMVSIKVLRNDKDCLDAGLGEVKMLALLATRDANNELPTVRLRDYFYYKEHLLIVTELLRDSLFQFYKYLDATHDRGVASYFTPSAIACISYQLLKGLEFVHSLGVRARAPISRFAPALAARVHACHVMHPRGTHPHSLPHSLAHSLPPPTFCCACRSWYIVTSSRRTFASCPHRSASSS